MNPDAMALIRKQNGVLLDAVRLAITELEHWQHMDESGSVQQVINALQDIVAKHATARALAPLVAHGDRAL